MNDVTLVKTLESLCNVFDNALDSLFAERVPTKAVHIVVEAAPWHVIRHQDYVLIVLVLVDKIKHVRNALCSHLSQYRNLLESFSALSVHLSKRGLFYQFNRYLSF